MNSTQRITLVALGAVLIAGCSTTSKPKAGGTTATTKPTIERAPELTNEPPPKISSPAPKPAPTRTAPVVETQKTTIPRERMAAIIGGWTRVWLSGAPGAVYRISKKSETELSMTTSEKDVVVEKMEFDGVKLSWTERGSDFTEQNSARLQPDGKMFLGMSWDPAAQTGRKFRLEKE